MVDLVKYFCVVLNFTSFIILMQISQSLSFVTGLNGRENNMQMMPYPMNIMQHQNFQRVDNLLSIPEEQAANILFSSIQSPPYPPDLMEVKNRLIFLIKNNELELEPALRYLTLFKVNNKIDYMIATLLTLRDTLSLECELRKDIDKLISFTVINKYMSHEHNSINCNMNGHLTGEQSLGANTCHQSLNCEFRTIEYLFNKLAELKNSCCKCDSTSSIKRQTNYHGALTKSTNQMSISQQNVNKLLTILPKPQNADEQLKFEQVSQFLKHAKLNILEDANLTKITNQKQFLRMVITKIIETTTIDIRIKEAFQYYLFDVDKREAVVKPLLDLLPKPKNQQEQAYFQTLSTFLKSFQSESLLQSISMEAFGNKQKYFAAILKQIVSLHLSVEVTEAAQYYLAFVEDLANLSFVGRRQIQKHFDLTEIFKDSFNLTKLPPDEVNNFKKFFDYLSKLDGKELSNFDTWSEASTRGEFVHVLFKYLEEQTFVPGDIKLTMNNLVPFIETAGKAALPP